MIFFGVKSSKRSFQDHVYHLYRTMKKRFTQLWRSSKSIIRSESGPGRERSCAGRILSSLTFSIIIICLGMWITAFILLKDRLFTETLSGTIFTDMTCLTFFGGLAIAIFVGALAGNFLRRAFWKRMTRRKKQ
jgi:hypothetical protein